jgi:hypothetical protein
VATYKIFDEIIINVSNLYCSWFSADFWKEVTIKLPVLMERSPMSLKTAIAYETDYYGWVQEQVELLESGQLDRLDVANLIEEIKSLGAAVRGFRINCPIAS